MTQRRIAQLRIIQYVTTIHKIPFPTLHTPFQIHTVEISTNRLAQPNPSSPKEDLPTHAIQKLPPRVSFRFPFDVEHSSFENWSRFRIADATIHNKAHPSSQTWPRITYEHVGHWRCFGGDFLLGMKQRHAQRYAGRSDRRVKSQENTNMAIGESCLEGQYGGGKRCE